MSNISKVILNIENLTYFYENQFNKIEIFKNLNFEIKEGEIIGFEKPGENWVFGINFDPTDSNLPKGFNNLITVFLDKCLESNS